MTNPYRLTNFEALRTSNPESVSADVDERVLHVGDRSGESPAAAVLAHQQPDCIENLPLGENKGGRFRFIVNRRYANGFTANMALSFTKTRSNRTVNEFDREPTLWLDDNSSRPYRLSGGAVYELPFGANRRWLSDGGVFAALAGGWQLAGTFERQPGSLINFGTNLFYNGDINNIKKDNPEIALDVNGHIDPNKYWFNVDGFVRDPAQTPTGVQHARVPVPDRRIEGPGADVREPQHPAQLRHRRTSHAAGPVRHSEPAELRGVRQSGDRPDEHELRQGRLGGLGRRRDAVLQLRPAVHVF